MYDNHLWRVFDAAVVVIMTIAAFVVATATVLFTALSVGMGLYNLLVEQPALWALAIQNTILLLWAVFACLVGMAVTRRLAQTAVMAFCSLICVDAPKWVDYTDDCLNF